jgi:hypothetical protein
MSLLSLTPFQFHFAGRPPPIYGATRYWAFERECINRALLDMITASLRRAAAAARQIHVRPAPATMAQVDFFHLAGFIVHRFNERNWLGKVNPYRW